MDPLTERAMALATEFMDLTGKISPFSTLSVQDR
jgi:hypothetical protein